MRTLRVSAAPVRGISCVALSGVLWGTIGITAQTIYQQADVSPIAVGFYRLALGLPAVAIICWFLVGRNIFQVSRQDYIKMSIIGVMLAVYQVAYFSAVSYIGVTIATLITLCTAPVIVALASAIFFREALTEYTLGALTLAVLGTGLLVGSPAELTDIRQFLLGAAFALLSAFGYATVTLISKPLSKNCHPLHTTTIAFLVGSLLLFPLVLSHQPSVAYSGTVWGLLFYLGLIPTAVGYIVFFLGVQFVKASTASILTMLEPLVATFLAWLLFAETLTPVAMIGAGLLLLSIGVLYQSEKIRSAS